MRQDHASTIFEYVVTFDWHGSSELLALLRGVLT